MVYMLKFDIAHSHAIYHKKEMNVRESPTGQVEKLSYLLIWIEKTIRTLI
jgi:hypothetical protein